jgi:hypothetical protein
MTHGLNLTLRIKQDPETQLKLKDLVANFATKVQPAIDAALKKSEIVHFARVLVVDNAYIQVITSYEGSHQEYTEFFRRELTPIFAAIFTLAEGAPDVSDTNAFWEYSKNHNVRALGTATDGSLDFSGKASGWLFSAYDHKTVKAIKAAIKAAGA